MSNAIANGGNLIYAGAGSSALWPPQAEQRELQGCERRSPCVRYRAPGANQSPAIGPLAGRGCLRAVPSERISQTQSGTTSKR